MLFSRIFNFSKKTNYLLVKRAWNLKVEQKRNSGHAVSYRVAPISHSKSTHLGANLVGAAMWWWILWHLWHEYEHITGEFYYPEPERWSNQELGVPDDKYD